MPHCPHIHIHCTYTRTAVRNRISARPADFPKSGRTVRFHGGGGEIIRSAGARQQLGWGGGGARILSPPPSWKRCASALAPSIKSTGTIAGGGGGANYCTVYSLLPTLPRSLSFLISPRGSGDVYCVVGLPPCEYAAVGVAPHRDTLDAMPY